MLDNYELLEQLGEGGMGIVFKARPPEGGRPVAVKVLKADLVRDQRAVHYFFKEARHMQALAHPNILGVLALHERYAHISYVFEDLERLAQGQEPLGPWRASMRARACFIASTTRIRQSYGNTSLCLSSVDWRLETWMATVSTK
jgi:hypothetical protein